MDGTAANRDPSWRETGHRRSARTPDPVLAAIGTLATPLRDLYIAAQHYGFKRAKALENARFSWTKSASSASAGLRLNSSSVAPAPRAPARPRSRRPAPARASRPRAARRAGRRGRRPARRRPRRRRGRGTRTRAPRARRAAPPARPRAARGAAAAPTRARSARCLRAPPPPAPSPRRRRSARPRAASRPRRPGRAPARRTGTRATRSSSSRRPRASGSSSRSARSSRPPRHARRAPCLRLGEPRRALGEEGAHGPLRKPPERDELAAREDRRRQRPELVRDEHDHRVRRRLLEILQQRVGGVLVQQVRVGDHVDAPVGLVRAHVQVAVERAHLVDPDHLAERLEQEEIGVRPGLHAALVTEQRGRERAGRGALADARPARGGDRRGPALRRPPP